MNNNDIQNTLTTGESIVDERIFMKSRVVRKVSALKANKVLERQFTEVVEIIRAGRRKAYAAVDTASVEGPLVGTNRFWKIFICQSSWIIKG
jgi:hypothetical protein